MTPVRIITVIEVDNSPGLYDAVDAADRHLCRSRMPLLSAARVLLAEGVDPSTRLVMRHAGSNVDSLTARGVRIAAGVSKFQPGHRQPRQYASKATGVRNKLAKFIFEDALAH